MTTSLADRVKQNRLNGVAERRAQLTPLEVPVPEGVTTGPVPASALRPMVPPQSRKPEWQRINRTQPRRVSAGPVVSIHKGGRNIVFNGDALMAMSLPHAVEAHLCLDPLMLGFRAARTDDMEAFPLLAPLKGSSRAIACTALIRRTGLSTDVGRRFRAVMQGDMLVVWLADDAVETDRPK